MDARKLSFSDLTFGDAWHLVKYYFGAVFLCGLVFALPYVLLVRMGRAVSSKAGIDPGSYSGWIEAVFWGVVILVLIFQLPDFLERFGTLLMEIGVAARRASVLKRTTGLLLFMSYMFLWQKFPTPTFFFTVFVVIPMGYTIEEHYKVLEKKAIEHEEE
jgi:hypothetical protein